MKMPRFYVAYKTTCTWATDVEGESEEAVRAMVTAEGWIPHDAELVTEEDVRDYLVVEQIEEEEDA
jgi:hypothetical protein